MKHFESFALDAANECLWQNGAPIPLPPKPFAVLRYLVEHPGRLVTHDELLEALWPETYVQPQVLRTYMLDLRKALGDDAREPRFLQTVPKRGFRFIAAVAEQAESGGESPSLAESAAPASGIVDRVEELAVLQAQFALAGQGQRQVVFLTGDAGIGKTALVDAFCAAVRARPGSGSRPRAAVARGQCVEGFGRKEEYYPVTEALAQVCASAEGEAACAVLARMAPAWLAALGRACPESPKAAARDRMPGELCAALEELASERPLILIFEDVQWADEATLQLISALARRRAPARLMLAATYRPQEVASEHPLRAIKQDLRMRRLCAEIALAPLARSSVGELLSRELRQQELPAGLARFVHRRSEGNPLFAIAILEHLMAEAYLTRESPEGSDAAPARWIMKAADNALEAGLPEGLAQMIELDVARLSPTEQRMLEAGALMPVAFPAWAVAAALELDPAETEEACQDLANRLYFVERAGQDELPDGSESSFFVFAHGLYREVLWRRQTEARRARRHVRIAERLAQLFAGREATVAREMALHYEAAGQWQNAVGALRSAAGHAGERQALAEAAELLEHALRLTQHLRPGDQESATEAICRELQHLRGLREPLPAAQNLAQTVSAKS